MFDSNPPRFVLEFTKMSGAGNDFIVIDNRFYQFPPNELSEMAARYCARRTAVGADGLLALCLPDRDSEETHFRMRYFNADGSLGSMCGNGARCLAQFARNAGIESEPLVFGSDAGIYTAQVKSGEEVTLWLPVYNSYRPGLESEDYMGPLCYIWTGTEHVVAFVDDVERVPINSIGPQLRSDQGLSLVGANVDFVEIVDASAIKVRTYEKGVEGETLACGTGAVASALTAALENRVEGREIRVSMPGGILTVGWTGEASSPESIYLKGPADITYRGTLEF